MSNNEQLGPNEAPQNENTPDQSVPAFFVESSLGIPFPEFDLPETVFVDESGEVQALDYWNGTSIPWCGGPPDGFFGGPGKPLVILQSRKRASFF